VHQTNNQQPTTNNQQPTTNNKEQRTKNKEQTLNPSSVVCKNGRPFNDTQFFESHNRHQASTRWHGLS
jgi:hypothetical protein